MFGDDGRDDTHTGTINWGDGTPVEDATLTETEGSGIASGYHAYPSLGTFTVTFTVTDDDGAAMTRTFAATVTNTPPAAPTGLALSGAAYIDGVPLTWQDNASDEDAYRIEWNDGEGWAVIEELPANSTSYLDEYPVLGETNQYRIVAVRGSEVTLEGASVPLGAYPITPPLATHDENGGAERARHADAVRHAPRPAAVDRRAGQRPRLRRRQFLGHDPRAARARERRRQRRRDADVHPRRPVRRDRHVQVQGQRRLGRQRRRRRRST